MSMPKSLRPLSPGISRLVVRKEGSQYAIRHTHS